MKFSEVQKIFDQYRLYKDRGVVRMVAASVISNQLIGKKRKPVWVVFVAPPGGGKSDVTGTLAGVTAVNHLGERTKLCEEISDLTTTSLASGMRSLDGETSLLAKLNRNGGIMLFKDFTTLLSKRQEDLSAIMSYLREIYDGSFEKKFGNGKTVVWEGKVGVVASCTTIIYHKLPELSVMGDRMMMYQVEQPDRLLVQQKIWENEDAGIDGSDEMSDAMKQYLEGIIDFIHSHKDEIDALKIDSSIRHEFGLVANFTTIARSGVVWNYKKDTISYVPDPEMPTRVLRQLISIAYAFMVMNVYETGESILLDEDKKIIYKIAFDSIPNMRRNVIKMVASYAYGATLEGVAEKLSMQYEAVRIWGEELIAVGVLDRIWDHGMKKYKYSLKSEFVELVKNYEHVTQLEESLVVENEDAKESNSQWF